ncbi:hypothetical protein GCM10009748_00870 [Agromyces lapidis]
MIASRLAPDGAPCVTATRRSGIDAESSGAGTALVTMLRPALSGGGIGGARRFDGMERVLRGGEPDVSGA